MFYFPGWSEPSKGPADWNYWGCWAEKTERLSINKNPTGAVSLSLIILKATNENQLRVDCSQKLYLNLRCEEEEVLLEMRLWLILSLILQAAKIPNIHFINFFPSQISHQRSPFIPGRYLFFRKEEIIWCNTFLFWQPPSGTKFDVQILILQIKLKIFNIIYITCGEGRTWNILLLFLNI